jgi:8-amino-7-oxononanoate synthase
MLPKPIQKRLHEWKNKNWIRLRSIVQYRNHAHIVIKNKMLINFTSSDYLGLAAHPDIKKSLAKSALRYGLGSTSSPLISGYSKAHHLLEEKWAEFLNRDKALLFNSGYHANLGVITTLCDRQCTIIADKYCHASLLDGIQLSRAHSFRFKHNDDHHAEFLLKNTKQNAHSLLISESVFSMRGDITIAESLAKLAKKYQATLLIDDAHGIGVLGKQGKGITEITQLSQTDLPCLVTPLGKAVGSMGALVSGPAELIDALVQFAKTYRYSTALPAAICQATLCAINLMEKESWRREFLQHLIRYFNMNAKARNIKLISFDETPIRCIVINDSSIALTIQNELIDYGFYVSCIRPPTVPKSLIRISLTSSHTETQIERLLDWFYLKISQFHE